MSKQPIITLSVPHSKRAASFPVRLKSSLQDEPSEHNVCEKLFVVSGVRANFSAFRKLLLNNRIIDKSYNWIFDDGHLVVIGDCLDFEGRGIECLWLIYSLEERASRNGGYIHFILGNHEIINLNGDWRYMQPKYALKPKPNRPLTAVYEGNNVLWKWLLTKNIIERIGDILFVHGSISVKMNLFDVPITKANQLARSNSTSAGQLFSNPLLNLISNSDLSPISYEVCWQSGEVAEMDIDDLLAKFSVGKIVTGYPTVSPIHSLFNGKVINIYTDHTIRKGKLQALLIVGDEFYRIDINGIQDRIG